MTIINCLGLTCEMPQAPVVAIPAFIAEANAAVIAAVPGARPFPFRHVGDDNIHYNIRQSEGADKAWFMAQEDNVQDTVFDIVLARSPPSTA